MDASDEIKSQLKSLLNEQIDLRAVLLKQEQARLQEQLSRTDRNLTQMEADRQATVDSQLQRIIKSAAAQAKKVAAKPNKTPSKTAP